MTATHNNIVVSPDKSPQRVGSLFLPDINNNNEAYGTVVSVGPDCKYGLKKGDEIVYLKDEGRDVDGLLVISEKHILAMVCNDV